MSSVSRATAAVEQRTPIGVDVGEDPLFVAAAVDADPADAQPVSGEGVRETLTHLVATTEALRSIPGETAAAETAIVAATWRRLRAMLTGSVPAVIDYARRFASPVLVLEALGHDARPLWEIRDADVSERGRWLLPVAQRALVAAADRANVPVTWVRPDGTTRECHVCEGRGEVLGPGADAKVLRCSTSSCPVDEVDRDASAAISIAQRA